MDVAARERASVRVAGPDAADHLQRLVSNDVEVIGDGEACPALLLTAKARVIAPLLVLRRGEDDFLLLTEPELGEVVREHLTRMRLRAQCEIEPEEHEAALVFGGKQGFATDWPGVCEALGAGEACPALLLTAKARVIAPLVVLRRGEDDFLLLTEPELGETVRAHLTRMRLRARCEIEPEEHSSTLVLDGSEGFATDWPGARELLDAELEPTLDAAELERRRIEAGVPRWRREIDERILPAEAGLEATHVSFSKGCYPGQEPVARLHFRGHPNRGLRVVELAELPEYDTPLLYEGREVGRVTSAAQRDDGSVVALAYVRTEVPDDAPLALAARTG